VASPRELVLRDGSGGSWQQQPMRGDGETTVEQFRKLPARQLLILGDPGTGKTVLAMLFTTHMIDQLGREPVPVFIPIHDWKPDAEHPQTYISRRLIEDHPRLAELDGGGVPLGYAMVDRGEILPVLDGLDEVSAKLIPAAVAALDAMVAAGRPLVVTCRSLHFERAVAGSSAYLSRAAVVEIEPVSPEAAFAYLGQQERDRWRWMPIFNQMRTDAQAPLSRVLRTPLMLSLARRAYEPPGTDPAELLGVGRRSQLRRRLIQRYLDAVYSRTLPPESDVPGRAPVPYDPQNAHRWLSTVAYIGYRQGTRDLLWRRLRLSTTAHPSERLRLRAVSTFVAFAALVGLLVGVLAAVGAGFRAGIAVALLVAAGREFVLSDLSGPPDPHTGKRRTAWVPRLIFCIALGGHHRPGR